MTDFSIDIETLGTSGRAYILSIGIAEFNIKTGEITATFECSVTANPNDFDIDIDTIMWWMRQDNEARMSIINFKREDLKKVLLAIKSALFNRPNAKVWGNGATFDISIMENAYKVCGVNVPWKHWDVRDMRTIVDMAVLKGFNKEDVKFTGVKHNALCDAIHQAKIISESYGVLIK